MKHIRILFSLVAMLFISTTSRAQGAEVTYIHEDDIMNQFTVMETGAGSLKPREYYQLMHKSYQKTAAATNKLSFRLENQVLTNKEVPLAEKVDSDLVKREGRSHQHRYKNTRRRRCRLDDGKGKDRE